jgi:hypothetical protein
VLKKNPVCIASVLHPEMSLPIAQAICHMWSMSQSKHPATIPTRMGSPPILPQCQLKAGSRQACGVLGRPVHGAMSREG